MNKTHANISIFVPHIGCPNRCSFCNQHSITGSHIAPRPEQIVEAIRKAVKSKNYSPENTEIAFFGGSFTAINRTYMLSLLKTASSFVENGVVSGIRISTRPNAIDDKILNLLKEYHVTAIELGAQSLDDNVLFMNNRGHTASDVFKSSLLIKEFGFELGLQMMTGLYGDDDEKAIKTAEKIIEIKPDTVRIYPTIILKDTYLEALYLDGKYSPQNLDDAVSLSVKLVKMFDDSGIKVIRLGLHSIEESSYIAGPWHPAFSELCSSKIFLDMSLEKIKESGKYNIFVSPSCMSKMIGQKQNNLKILKSKGYDCKVKSDLLLSPQEIRIERIE